ncbi:SMI1/KNR4 family protein [Deinococcus sp. Arct2-2]|uniref:SMI1/KNR4 family protein n=1 Tax=Deinococcus sp. Arct2-2 TaxID=2568653 RepID=UPI0010A58115|nr:SMI1/KNR4 family protein [Deinococcus sp. Arct2-2]THF67771.1 SMI1/KNR4 family protein [Deinococcus sp. Arct2-2]
MSVQDITKSLHPSVEIEDIGEPRFSQELLLGYQKSLCLIIPDWYKEFLTIYGAPILQVNAQKARFDCVCVFDLQDSKGYFQDYNFDDEVFKGRLPIASDLGGRTFFYSERDGKPGVYLTYAPLDEECLEFIAPSLQSMLFEGVGLSVC